MSVKIVSNGTFSPDENDIFVVSEGGSEISEIESFSISIEHIHAIDSSTLCAFLISITRKAGLGSPDEDLFGLELISGEAKRGEKKIFPCEIWLIDDTKQGAESCLGRFTIPRTQLTHFSISDSSHSNPTQKLVFRAYELNYIIGSNNSPLSDDPDVVPLISKNSR